ncbi:MAG: hypothetical protein EBU81_12815, partial [Proteobacteria bacterium]|nr:hypothetical protein [Pseudomonadota bacterium]
MAVFTTGSGVSAMRYTGVKASLGVARLQGVSAVEMVATNFSIQLNRVSVGSTLLDWTQGQADVASVNNPLSAAGLAITATAPALQIGGSVGLSLAEVVYGSAQFTVSRGAVTGVDDPDEATGATLNGDLLAVSVSQGNLFIGTGASLDLSTGVVSLPASDSATAVGFGITNASLNLGIFAANQRVVSGTVSALSTPQRYTGLTGLFDRAELQGVNALRMVGTNLSFKLNRTSVSNGAVLDWKQGKALVSDAANPLAAAGVSLGVADPTFEIGGSVGLSIADVVLGNATVKVGRSLISGVTVGADTLKGDLLSVAVTGADLFIGTGATFNTTTGFVTLPAETSTTAVGFRVSGGTLNLGVFTSREKQVSGSYAALGAADIRKYTGLTGSLGSARLQGVDAVKMIGSGLTLSLNRVSSGTAVMDWKQGKTL